MQCLVPEMSVDNSCLQLLIEASEMAIVTIKVRANNNWFMKLKIENLGNEVSLHMGLKISEIILKLLKTMPLCRVICIL